MMFPVHAKLFHSERILVDHGECLLRLDENEHEVHLTSWNNAINKYSVQEFVAQKLKGPDSKADLAVISLVFNMEKPVVRWELSVKWDDFLHLYRFIEAFNEIIDKKLTVNNPKIDLKRSFNDDREVREKMPATSLLNKRICELDEKRKESAEMQPNMEERSPEMVSTRKSTVFNRANSAPFAPMPEKELVADVTIIRTKGSLLNLNNRRISIVDDTIRIIGGNNNLNYKINCFSYKKLKMPESGDRQVFVSIHFGPSNEKLKPDVAMKLGVNPEYQPLLTQFIETFNKLIEANKDTMKSNKTKMKSTSDSYDMHDRDNLQEFSIIKKKSCERTERILVKEELEEEQRIGKPSSLLSVTKPSTVQRLVSGERPSVTKT